MADRLELAFRREAEPLIPAGSRLLVAVSGGADSVALLRLLARRAPARAWTLGAAHLDHGMRRGATADRRFVERLARELELPFHSERREVPALRRKEESPEEGARRIRRAFLLETAREHGYAHIVTGHTLDDQAETVLMRLARGSGTTALAGIAAHGPGPFLRPLLTIERAELRAYLQRKAFEWREDPSNRDLRYDRNRVRLRLLPMLERTLNPRAARHLVRAARLLREDTQLLDGLAAQGLDELSRLDRTGRLRLDAAGVAALAPPIARRLARFALTRAGVDARRVSSRHVDGLLDLASGGGNRRLDLPGGLRASRRRDELRIGP